MFGKIDIGHWHDRPNATYLGDASQKGNNSPLLMVSRCIGASLFTVEPVLNIMKYPCWPGPTVQINWLVSQIPSNHQSNHILTTRGRSMTLFEHKSAKRRPLVVRMVELLSTKQTTTSRTSHSQGLNGIRPKTWNWNYSKYVASGK